MGFVDFSGEKCRDIIPVTYGWYGKDMKDISILNMGDMIQFVEHMFQPS